MKIIIIFLHLLFGILIVRYTTISDSDFFLMNNQVTYLGVLVGFSLTLFTFGISILKDIYSKIDDLKFKDLKNKSLVINLIRLTFNEIKDDIKIIFYAIIAVFINEILANTVNPFGWSVEGLRIPNVISIVVFTISTHALYDIMTALFELAKVLLQRNNS